MLWCFYRYRISKNKNILKCIGYSHNKKFLKRFSILIIWNNLSILFLVFFSLHKICFEIYFQNDVVTKNISAFIPMRILSQTILKVHKSWTDDWHWFTLMAEKIRYHLNFLSLTHKKNTQTRWQLKSNRVNKQNV